MTVHPAVCVYQETRLSLDAPGTVVDVSLSGNNSTPLVSRQSPKRRRIDRQSDAPEESAFAASHLASDSSIYFRNVQDPQAPKSILWRVLDQATTLELQPVDLHGPSVDLLPAPAALRFTFPDAIIPCGVVLTAPTTQAKSDTLVVFVFTKRPDLYRLTLKKEAFSNPSHFEDERLKSHWFAQCTPSALSYRRPYRAVAQRAEDLWVSLDDGGLIHLHWESLEATKWSEIRFSEGNWGGSILGMIRRSHPLVNYADTKLDSRSASTITPSPTGKLIWTACLDHTIRAWNTSTGKTVLIHDLADNDDRDLRQPFDNPLDPHQPALIHLEKSKANAESGQYQLVTYSPMTQTFSFWSVDETDLDEVRLRPEHTTNSFVPPVDELLEVSGWRLEQYHLVPPKNQRSHHWGLWLLVRCAGRSDVLYLNFSPTAKANESRATWESGWSKVHPGLSSAEEMKTSLLNPQNFDLQGGVASVLSSTEQWLQFILTPGRFSPKLLETALAIYRGGTNKSLGNPALAARKSLEEEICATVGSSLTSQTNANLAQNFLGYEKDIARQWAIFYGVIQDLQRQKERPLNLALDAFSDLAWVVSADQISPIRSCAMIENLWHNRSTFRESHSPPTRISHNPLWEALQFAETRIQAGKLLNALSILRASLPHSFVRHFKTLVMADFLSAGEEPAFDRMRALYSDSAFNGQLSDEDFSKVTDALDGMGGFEGLTNAPFDTILAAMIPDQWDDGPSESLTRPYGFRLLYEGARDTLSLNDDILLSMALFVVFTAVELEPSDISSDFFPDEIYELLGPKALENELLNFFARSPLKNAESGASILEGITGDSERRPEAVKSEPRFLTSWIRTWSSSLVETNGLTLLGPKVLSFLVKNGEVELARQLSDFILPSSWASYFKGRSMLLAGDPHLAAGYFLDASGDLARSNYANATDLPGLVQPLEQIHFGHGHSAYYQHILSLFEQNMYMSYVADFGRLAIQHMTEESRESISARADILSRIFTSSIRTLRFQDAFDALIKYTDSALRRVALQTLVNVLIATSRVSLLTRLAFPADLDAEVDAHIATLASSPQTLPQVLAKSLTGHDLETGTSLPPPHQILYAYRVAHNNYRGAAEALWEHLQQLRLLRGQGARGVNVDAEIADTYLSCINALCLVEESMRWLLVRPVHIPSAKNALGKSVVRESGINREKRALVTLDDVRREWQEYLDWQSDLAAGRYALPLSEDDEDDMDVEEDAVGAYARPDMAHYGNGSSNEVDPFVA